MDSHIPYLVSLVDADKVAKLKRASITPLFCVHRMGTTDRRGMSCKSLELDWEVLREEVTDVT